MSKDPYYRPANPESILEEAQRLVYGDRQQDYGHPLEDFSRTAALWSALFAGKLREPLQAEEVALAMVCVKLSREVNRPKRDNLVDGAGYFATLAMVRERRGEPIRCPWCNQPGHGADRCPERG